MLLTRPACLVPTLSFLVREHTCIYPHISAWSPSFTSQSINPHKSLSDILYLQQDINVFCIFILLTLDSQSSPLVRSGLLGSTRVPQGSATCMSWGGAHYRTFDRKHFHFQGSCTYVLASSSDGTWAVYISTVCEGRGDCSKVAHMLDSITDAGHNYIISSIFFVTL